MGKILCFFYASSHSFSAAISQFFISQQRTNTPIRLCALHWLCLMVLFFLPSWNCIKWFSSEQKRAQFSVRILCRSMSLFVFMCGCQKNVCISAVGGFVWMHFCQDCVKSYIVIMVVNKRENLCKRPKRDVFACVFFLCRFATYKNW